MSSIDKIGFYIAVIGLVFIGLIFLVQYSFGAITYLDTIECFQSEEHFLQTQKQNLQLYNYVKPIGICSWGGYLIQIQVPQIQQYEKDYKYSIGSILTTPTLSASISE